MVSFIMANRKQFGQNAIKHDAPSVNTGQKNLHPELLKAFEVSRTSANIYFKKVYHC